MTIRKAILTAHLYLGLASGLLFSATGLTGSLLVFSEELDHWANPTLLTVVPGTAPADLSAIEASVSERFPNEAVYRIRMPRSDEETIEFWMGRAGDLRVYADPYTGNILGSRRFSETWRGLLFGFHTELFSGERGKTVLGIGGFVLIAIGLTGIVLWWRGRRNLLRGLRVNVRNGWRRANFDLHNT
ncbi:MAG: PepSY-associated TM helix domain-containing protein, partial [Pyrinomonadaceae bacterium]|nr:PepSY-associated TM helix domain-containing protein [Pyrinomonadaceae bacterium]